MANKRNHEGYSDPTAYNAMTAETEEMAKIGRLVKIIKYICGLAGYELESRLVLRNKETDRVWK